MFPQNGKIELKRFDEVEDVKCLDVTSLGLSAIRGLER